VFRGDRLGMNDERVRVCDWCTAVSSVCAHACAQRVGCDWCDGGARSFFGKKFDSVGVSALGPLTDTSGEFLDVIEHLTPLSHLRQDFSLGVHDRGVVTAERLADLGQGEVGELAA
jgi:hypothetical protein